MSLSILVIDDQIARSEEEQTHFLRAIGELSGYAGDRHKLGYFKVVFCSGQRIDANQIINDIEVAVGAVDSNKDWTLVLLDMQFDSGSIILSGIPNGQPGDAMFGGKIERELLNQFPNLPIVRFSGKSEQELDQTARPYLAKLNLTPDEFRFTLLSHGKLNLQQKWDLLGLDQTTFISSNVMFDVYCQARKLSPTEDPVLIQGETGTGKEILAQYIHRYSGRADFPFVPVNVSAMPENLADSEFFGHERGAFTGAERLKKGYFEQAGNGTIFLDEIGDMLQEHQLRLLRVLQERQFRRVGGTVLVPFNGRVILATHRDLEERIKEGRFREDLYNRLTLKLILHPLHHRREEIVPMADRFLSEAAFKLGKQGISLDESAHQRLIEYSFPGNVRELAALMKVVAITAGNNRLIRADDLPIHGSFTPIRALQTERVAYHQTGSSKPDQSPVTIQTLAQVDEILRTFSIIPGDDALAGIKPRLENALRLLLLNCTVACLEHCRHPVTRKFMLLPAMQILTGNPELKGTGAKRLLNEVLGRNHGTAVTQEEMGALCSIYDKKNEKALEMKI